MTEWETMERFALELTRKETENEELRKRIELLIELGKHCSVCQAEGAEAMSEARDLIDRQRGIKADRAVCSSFRDLSPRSVTS
jgi:hypothetical protein